MFLFSSGVFLDFRTAATLVFLLRRCLPRLPHRRCAYFSSQAVHLTTPAPPPRSFFSPGGTSLDFRTAATLFFLFRRCFPLLPHRCYACFSPQAVLSSTSAPPLRLFFFSGGAFLYFRTAATLVFLLRRCISLLPYRCYACFSPQAVHLSTFYGLQCQTAFRPVIFPRYLRVAVPNRIPARNLPSLFTGCRAKTHSSPYSLLAIYGLQRQT